MPGHPAELLQRLADACSGNGLPVADAAAIRAAVDAYLAGKAGSLDQAFGLKPRAGERSWRTAAAIAERDRLIRQTAIKFWPAHKHAQQARLLAGALRHYGGTAWSREKLAEECPTRHRGQIYEACWFILRARDYSVSERQIRSILAAS